MAALNWQGREGVASACMRIGKILSPFGDSLHSARELNAAEKFNDWTMGARGVIIAQRDRLFNGLMFYAANHLTSWHMSLALMTLLTYSAEHATC